MRKRLLVPVIVPVLLIGWAALPSQAAVAPAAGGIYAVASASSGKCVNATDASVLVQIACSAGAAGQQWKVAATGSAVQLVNGGSGKCADGTASGVQATQSACGSATTQQWTFTASAAASGKYLIKNVSTGLCLTNKDASTAGNNPIVAQACSDIAQMQWSFNYVSGPIGTQPTVASDGTGLYQTVQAAINAVPANSTTRQTITIKAGTYREQIKVPADKPNITLQGLGSAAAQTVIVYNHDAGTYGATGSATAWILGKNFAATNLTVSNDYGEGSQALAMYMDGDRAVFTNTRLLGAQDTLRVEDGNRAYFVNSYVEGTVDFIYSGGTAVFNACQIYEKRSSGGPITAGSTPAGTTYGFLIYKSTITGAAGNVTQLGRPWQQTAQVLYRESALSATIKTARPWADMGDATWRNARFYEYKNTGAGAGANSNRPQMSDAMAADYTPQKYLAGSDGWNPIG